MQSEQARKHQRWLEDQLKSLQTDIRELPRGTLCLEHNGPYVKWYRLDGRERTYIRKREVRLAVRLARKKYLKARAADLTAEKKAVEAYLSALPEHSQVDRLMADEEFRRLFSCCEGDQAVADAMGWMNEAYPTNPRNPEGKRFKTLSGISVRSKSEVIIADCLFRHQIPFRYEAELPLREYTVYPDFMVMHPRTKEILVYEHFGMMDVPSYRDTAYNKLKSYGNEGYYPTLNLVVTFETAEHPLDTAQVEEIVEKYFLS